MAAIKKGEKGNESLTSGYKVGTESGIGQADVLYEFVVEGGITRMLAIFNDYDNLEKVGSIRSCRPYYVTTAMEFGKKTYRNTNMAVMNSDRRYIRWK